MYLDRLFLRDGPAPPFPRLRPALRLGAGGFRNEELGEGYGDLCWRRRLRPDFPRRLEPEVGDAGLANPLDRGFEPRLEVWPG